MTCWLQHIGKKTDFSRIQPKTVEQKLEMNIFFFILRHNLKIHKAKSIVKREQHKQSVLDHLSRCTTAV